MDTLTFITKLLEHAAWPVAAIAIVIFFRSEIRALLPHIKQLKAGPVEAEFDRAATDLSNKTAALPAPSSSRVPSDPEDYVARQLASFNPRSAILEAWREVEIAANQALAKRESHKVQAPKRAAEVVGELATAGLLSSELSTTLQSLHSLRNQVAHEHGFNPSVTAARKYVESAKQIKVLLEGLVVAG